MKASLLNATTTANSLTIYPASQRRACRPKAMELWQNASLATDWIEVIQVPAGKMPRDGSLLCSSLSVYWRKVAYDETKQ
jgi:hypothetical protein